MSAAAQRDGEPSFRFSVNGAAVVVSDRADLRLSRVLRERLGLTGTKVGCDAGDCGACTVLLNDRQVCACLVPLGQLDGARVVTVEGFADARPRFAALTRAFQRHGAAQCGICTPGMLLAAGDLLAREPRPDRAAIEDALGGVLCRCTGYRKIIAAVAAVAADAADDAPGAVADPPAGAAVGSRLGKLDGAGKLDGSDRFGADAAPADCLWLKVIRSPHPRARFVLGDTASLPARFPGLVRVLTAADVPVNNFGIYPDLKDQPVFADGAVRFRGEAVLALVGERDALDAIGVDDLPLSWQPLEPVLGLDAALADGAAAVHADRPDNILVRGQVVKGDIDAVDAAAVAARVCGQWRTSFVEHAYIEPEAGYAERRGRRLLISVSTQTPFMDRDEAAHVLGLDPQQVQIRSTCCGGGFGGKLDQSVQPLLAVAAWTLQRPVRCVYSRIESMASTSKRHPARLRASACAGADGRLLSYEFSGDFNTGAYASWGPTVAGRVPVHAAGPYRVPHVRARSRAVYSNDTPAGAFRGFGVPQTALAHETLMDELAARLGHDPLRFRLLNALRPGDATATGQVLEHSVGLAACLQRLTPRWDELRAAAARFNRAADGPLRRGVGVGCMWYGLGNTSMSNPSKIKVALGRDGRLTFYNGVQDIGQGSHTIMVQILADAIGVETSRIDVVSNDTDLTFDAGKTSASRQTFVSGKAVQLAGEDLRQQLLRLGNAGADATLTFGAGRVTLRDRGRTRSVELTRLPAPAQEPDDVALIGVGYFDPPTTALDQYGQGRPYASYGFAAQIAVLDVDLELGTVALQKIVAAHDVGRAVNPTQVEGQIHGGIAQGIGLALMEEFIPGRTENLHDYLIPTCGDVPDIEVMLIEDPEPLGPFGAKGIGEPALVATAPAILNAIHHACGARIRHVPALPHRVLAALDETRATRA